MSTYMQKLEEESAMLRKIIEFDARIIKDYEALLEEYRLRIVNDRHEYERRLRRVKIG